MFRLSILFIAFLAIGCSKQEFQAANDDHLIAGYEEDIQAAIDANPELIDQINAGFDDSVITSAAKACFKYRAGRRNNIRAAVCYKNKGVKTPAQARRILGSAYRCWNGKWFGMPVVHCRR